MCLRMRSLSFGGQDGTMSPPAEDYYCRQFQPNTFDPSRCSSCLRPDHMHVGSTPAAAAALQDAPQVLVCSYINDAVSAVQPPGSAQRFRLKIDQSIFQLIMLPITRTHPLTNFKTKYASTAEGRSNI